MAKFEMQASAEQLKSTNLQSLKFSKESIEKAINNEKNSYKPDNNFIQKLNVAKDKINRTMNLHEKVWNSIPPESKPGEKITLRGFVPASKQQTSVNDLVKFANENNLDAAQKAADVGGIDGFSIEQESLLSKLASMKSGPLSLGNLLIGGGAASLLAGKLTGVKWFPLLKFLTPKITTALTTLFATSPVGALLVCAGLALKLAPVFKKLIGNRLANKFVLGDLQNSISQNEQDTSASQQEAAPTDPAAAAPAAEAAAEKAAAEKAAAEKAAAEKAENERIAAEDKIKYNIESHKFMTAKDTLLEYKNTFGETQNYKDLMKKFKQSIENDIISFSKTNYISLAGSFLDIYKEVFGECDVYKNLKEEVSKAAEDKFKQEKPNIENLISQKKYDEAETAIVRLSDDLEKNPQFKEQIDALTNSLDAAKKADEEAAKKAADEKAAEEAARKAEEDKQLEQVKELSTADMYLAIYTGNFENEKLKSEFGDSDKLNGKTREEIQKLLDLKLKRTLEDIQKEDPNISEDSKKITTALINKYMEEFSSNDRLNSAINSLASKDDRKFSENSSAIGMEITKLMEKNNEANESKEMLELLLLIKRQKELNKQENKGPADIKNDLQAENGV